MLMLIGRAIIGAPRKLEAASGTLVSGLHRSLKSLVSRMPKFYFDTIEGGRTGLDEEGLDLVDEAAARRMAWTCLTEVLADMRLPVEADLAFLIIVRDEQRTPIFQIAAQGGPPA